MFIKFINNNNTNGDYNVANTNNEKGIDFIIILFFIRLNIIVWLGYY